MLEFENPGAANMTGSAAFFKAVWRFMMMFFGSSLIGMLSGLCSALVSFLNTGNFTLHFISKKKHWKFLISFYLHKNIGKFTLHFTSMKKGKIHTSFYLDEKMENSHFILPP